MLVQKMKDLPKIGSIPNLISLDTETKQDKSIEGYSFAYAVGKAIKSFYVPINHDLNEKESLIYTNIDFDFGIEYLKNLCSNRRIIFHNAQFDLGVLYDYGIDIKLKNVEDTLLMHWMLDTERQHGLKSIMKNEYHIETITYDEAKLLGFDEFAKYGDNDARYTLFLYSKLIKEMRKHKNTYESYRKYEIPFIKVLLGMNKFNNGVRIDYQLLKHYSEMVEFEINSLHNILKNKMGNINFNSTKQLAPVLERFGYKVQYNTPTKHMVEMARKKGTEVTLNPSLGESELIKMQKKQGGKIIEVLLYYRGMIKLNSTYISSYLEKIKKIANDVWELQGYNFNHTGTRHGRLSSSNPNQQNIVRDVILLKMHFLNILQSKGIISGNKEYLDDKQIAKIINVRKKEVTEEFKKYEKDILDAFEKSSVDIRKLYIPHPGMIYLGLDYCAAEGTMISTEKGYIPIEMLTTDDYAMQEDKSVRKVEAVKNVGIKEGFRITVNGGYSLITSDMHGYRVLDDNGDYVWKRLKDIKIGDFIAINSNYLVDGIPYIPLPTVKFDHSFNNIDVFTPEYFDEDFAYLMGFIVGNGSFRHKGISYWVNEFDTDLAKYLKILVKKCFNADVTCGKLYKGAYEYHFYSRPLIRLFDFLGFSKEKVPYDLWKSSASVVGAFLSGLFDSDGSVDSEHISYTSSRKAIVSEVQQFLLGLGISSHFKEVAVKLNGKEFLGYTLNIRKGYFTLFNEVVGFRSSIKNKILLEAAEKSKNSLTSAIISMPNQSNKVKKLNLHGEARRLLNNVSSLNRPITFNLAFKLKNEHKEIYDKLNLKHIVENNTLFRRVISIESVGKIPMYDIQVNDTATYIAEGFVVHNSQLELRMMAHFSKDKVMIEAYNNGEDIHAKTRDGINSIVGKEIMDRQFGKLTNFFLQYGGYITSLAAMLGVSKKVASDIYYGFEKLYDGRTAWVKKTHIAVTKSHFVQTILGRRRNVGALGITDFSNFARRNNALNGSISTVISGSSSDLIKIAMLKINKLKDVLIKLQIHDELLIEVPEKKADIILPKVKSLMIEAIPLIVPIEVDGGKGYSWRQVHA